MKLELWFSEIDSLSKLELDVSWKLYLETEKHYLKKMMISKSRLDDIQKEIAELKSKNDEMTAKYKKKRVKY